MKIESSIAPVTGADRGRGPAYAKALPAAGANKLYAASRGPAKVTTPGVRQEPAAVGWTAPDGCAVTIRPIRPTDLDLEEAFVNSLSATTGYQRLMSSRKPSLEELRQFTRIDPQRELALIALTTVQGSERQIGVARFVLDSQTGDAEFAMVLRDDWQGRGLGAKLLGSLLAAARDFGVGRLSGVTFSTNAGMIALGRKLGFSIAADPRDATVTNMTLGVQA
ncbi:MAG: GNAT family N-acetyltransferase [Burkholderiales bacterium]|nr:GNAT family N-acetyltransferase [Burkholderiales bacterium]